MVETRRQEFLRKHPEEALKESEKLEESRREKESKKRKKLEKETGKEEEEKTVKEKEGPSTSTTKKTESKNKKTKSEAKNIVNVLEKGHLYFLYRPKVDLKEARDADDIQRLILLMIPEHQEGHEEKKRALIIPKKKLPEKNQRLLMINSQVDEEMDNLAEHLKKETYQTFTRGERTLEACRPFAEALYEIVEHKHDHGTHTHLTYALVLPKRIGNVHKALNVHREGSFIIVIKNPDTNVWGNAKQGSTSATRTFHPAKKPEFSPDLIKVLEGKRFVPVNPIDFLNVEGAQFIVIGATPEEALGHHEALEKANDISDLGGLEVQLGEEGKKLEKEAKEEQKRVDEEKLVKDLHLDPKETNLESLKKGEFQ
ncbi:hypothetical protein ABK040_007861 [Willaertia magna]